MRGGSAGGGDAEEICVNGGEELACLLTNGEKEFESDS